MIWMYLFSLVCCFKGWITCWCNFFSLSKVFVIQILFLYVHVCEKGWEALIYIHFFNTPQIVYTVSSPFVGHYDGGIVMEIPQSCSVLWGSKNSIAFLTSCTAPDFSKSLKGQYYLVSDSFICNSILIIMLATSNPTGLAALTLFSMRLLTSQMPSWLPSSGHSICRFPQGRAAHRMWAYLFVISVFLGLWSHKDYQLPWQLSDAELGPGWGK